ncbi:MAG: hypothetical protein LBV08_06670 [Clostridiales bacterium]|nr:hypothetical protein [Clostridiales bacterium]
MLKRICTLFAVSIISILSLGACKEIPYLSKDLTQEQAVAEAPKILISEEERKFFESLAAHADVKAVAESEEGSKIFTEEEFKALITTDLPYEYELVSFFVSGSAFQIQVKSGEETLLFEMDATTQTIYKTLTVLDENGQTVGDIFSNMNNETFSKSYKQKF